MTREKLVEIFNETQEMYVAEHLNETKITEAIARYADEDKKIDSTQMLSFAYIEGFKNSLNFLWEILQNIVVYEEQHKEEDIESIVKKVIEHGHNIKKSTGKNPFDF